MSNYDPTTEGVADHDPTERPADPSVDLVKDIVYGDMDETGPKLRDYIRNESVRAINENAW
jgi:hypothetical protein